jgi:beta-glucosidase
MKAFKFLAVFLMAILLPGLHSARQESLSGSLHEKRVDSLLSRMTLEEKIGQMSSLASSWDVTGQRVSEEDLDLIRTGRIGSIFNIYTAAYTRELQKIAVEQTRLGIPLLFGYDVIHGHKTIFPIPLGESASWDLKAIEKSARIAATEAAASGLHWTFAPMVDVARDPRWGRIAEGAGEDPYLGEEIARARVRGFQGTDLSDKLTIIACAKHFAAYGAAQAGREYHTVDISDRTLKEVYLRPFKAAVESGVSTIMTAFNELNGVPASGNPYLLRDILRNEWGFRGFVVSDYTSINEMVAHGVAEDLKSAALLAASAGVDMDLHGMTYDQHLAELVDEGKVGIETVNHAVRTILLMKSRLGLFDDPYRYCDEELEKRMIYHPDHLEWSREMARKSMVLLKNDKNILPLSPKGKIAVIGPLAEAKRDLLGAWKAAGDWDRVRSVLEAVRHAAGRETQILYAQGCDVNSSRRDGFAEAIAIAGQADVVIFIAGESWDMSGEAASRSDIGLPGRQTELIRELEKTGKPLVMILMTGRPLALQEENDLVDALLVAWFPGTEGALAVADTLFGKNNPSGKLPVTFPRTLGQVPIFYSLKNTGRPASEEVRNTSKYLDVPCTPLYPFGYGLSYTTFEYGNPELSRTSSSRGEHMTVTIKVRNTGKSDGEEVVQLYTRQMVASVTRPVLELKGFEKVFIPSGGSVVVRFVLNEDSLSFYRKDMTYGPEPGLIKVFVGGSSDNLQEAQFRMLRVL